MTQHAPARRGFSLLSVIFAAIAVVLFAVAAWMAWPLLTGGGATTPPTGVAGALQAVHVTDALAGQGLAVEQNQGFIPLGALGVPGQGTTVDGVPLFIFIFPDAATAEADLASADPAVLGPRGTPVPGVTPELFHSSNIVAALFDGPDDVRTKVEQAIARLP